MAQCEVCGNHYDNSFQVVTGLAQEARVFDCFECAIHALAPRCHRCGCSVIGHGTEIDGVVFCSSHCGREGADAWVDASGDNSFAASDPPAASSVFAVRPTPPGMRRQEGIVRGCT